MQLITVVGARPQFIKAAALSRAITSTHAGPKAIQEKILHTGQHYDAAMSDQFFVELGIPEPAFHLGIGGGSHGANTGRMLEAIEAVLLECGWNRLADPADSTAMLTAMAQQLELDPSQPRPPLYGDGHAAEAIVARIQQL